MRRQAVRTLSLMLAVLLGLAAPARAATITFDDVVRTVGASGQLRPAPASEVRLRTIAQNTGTTQSGTTAQSGNTSSQQQSGNSSTQSQQQSGTQTPATPNPTLSQGGAGQVQTVDLGDVTGTVCDCGEIPPPAATPKGGFPWWPLLGIPLICVTGICTTDHHNTPECVVGCTPPPGPPVPEPISLLLFGSGLLALGAGGRRRRNKNSEETSTATTTEEV